MKSSPLSNLRSPLSSSYDLIVVGGTLTAVAAAVAAKERGLKVLVVAPRPYLGEDLAGKLRLVREDPKGKLPPITRSIYVAAGHKGATLLGDTTPMQIKRVLDRALIDAQIPFVTWTVATGIVCDENGDACGVEIATKNGREIIATHGVIDATERARLARAVAKEPMGLNEADFSFTRYIVSGEAPKDARVTSTRVAGPVDIPEGVRGPHQPDTWPKTIPASLWKCEMSIHMKDGSARSFAEAEQVARDLTWTPLQLDAADELIFEDLPPVSEEAGLELFVRRIVVADSSTHLTPADAERYGAAAGAVFADGLRSVKKFAEPKKTKIIRATESAACDVFVAGAGTGGAPAAISAARAGAKTIVAEYMQRMGGVMTDGLIGLYCFGLKVGFTHEMDEALPSMGAIYGQCKAEYFRATARGAGADVWFGARVCGAKKTHGAVSSVDVAFQDGTLMTVSVANVVDATGNADVAALAGVPTEFIDGTELSLQGAGSTPKILGTSYQNTDYAFIDETDVADLTHFTLRARQNFGAYVWDQSQIVNSRERRRIRGALYLTAEDMMANRTHPDVISQARSNFDTHGQTIAPQFFIVAPHAEQPLVVNIPLRALLPAKVDGLLVTGLGMSAHRDAMPVIRMQPDVQNQGYAAGLAAAQSAKDGVRVRDIDIRKLQRKLVKLGIVPRDVLTWKDSFPFSKKALAAAIVTLPNNYEGLPVVFADPRAALPLLRRAFDAAKTDDARLVYAHALGLLGDARGAAVLRSKLASTTAWDDGWNYKGMDQFGRSVSWIDSYIIAYGRTRDEKIVDTLAPLAAKLEGVSHYSHFRAIALALETAGDPRGAKILSKLLAVPEVAGHHQASGSIEPVPGYETFVTKNLGIGDMERSDCLRELCVARALYRLGDDRAHHGLKTLRAYAADPRRAYARHALAVLGECSR